MSHDRTRYCRLLRLDDGLLELREQGYAGSTNFGPHQQRRISQLRAPRLASTGVLPSPRAVADKRSSPRPDPTSKRRLRVTVLASDEGAAIPTVLPRPWPTGGLTRCPTHRRSGEPFDHGY
jgi:hypothetical protein